MDQRNFEYLFYGFLAAWLIVLIYLVILSLRQRRLRQEIDQVRNMIDDRK